MTDIPYIMIHGAILYETGTSTGAIIYPEKEIACRTHRDPRGGQKSAGVKTYIYPYGNIYGAKD